MGADYSLDKIVLFDGVCNLCNYSVQFIIKRNKKENIYFTSIQSDAGQELSRQFEIQNNLKTIVYLKCGITFVKSNAALEIARELNGLWPLLVIFKIIPRYFRDLVYDFIARNRYRWFGKRDECWLPAPELKARFIQDLQH